MRFGSSACLNVKIALALGMGLIAAASPVFADGRAKRTTGADPSSMQPLSQTGQWLVDRAGRVVQLHGLTLYQKKPPFIDQISVADLDYVTSQGFNSFRINWVWQAAEPQPGGYDDAYFDKVVGLNDQFASVGIRTLLGPAHNSFSARFGGFGTPLWATVNRKLCQEPAQQTNCIKDARERYLGSDGEFEAWQNFYDDVPAADGVGGLTRFTRTWQRMASRLKGRTNVFALDLFHEPAPGELYAEKGERRFLTEPVTFEQEGLPRFYKSVGDAVRKKNSGPIIFFQISNYYTLLDTAKAGIHVPAKFTDAPKLGMSFHFGPIDLAKHSNEVFLEKTAQTLTTASAYSRNAQVAMMLTGYRLGKDETQYADFTDMLGSRFIPWNYYTFRGMPDPGAESSGILIDPTKPAADDNAKAQRMDAMVVPYPQLIAGTPKQWSFDRATRMVRFTYSTQPVSANRPCARAATEIFVPARQYPQGYFAEVRGAKIISSPTSAWLVLRHLRSAREVSVTIRPGNASYTEKPATALGPTANVICP
jgi:endoglycosylceramidase